MNSCGRWLQLWNVDLPAGSQNIWDSRCNILTDGPWEERTVVCVLAVAKLWLGYWSLLSRDPQGTSQTSMDIFLTIFKCSKSYFKWLFQDFIFDRFKSPSIHDHVFKASLGWGFKRGQTTRAQTTHPASIFCDQQSQQSWVWKRACVYVCVCVAVV